MYLTDFMNSNYNNWKELLTTAPYYLNIQQDNDYYILKYNTIMSDFNLPEVLEARGSIFRQNPKNKEWICVCHPFDKFFNYGEQYSAVKNIDWNSFSVLQKIDGSLIKIWYDRDKWHISTNGTINAAKAECGNYNFNFIVNKAIEKIPNFWNSLNPTYCYMFELTSPWNRIVIHYDDIKLWYLGCRNMISDKEVNEPLKLKGLFYPQIFSYTSLEECILAAHKMNDNEEGYVIVDKNFNRIKIKGDEYLRLHKIRGNGPLTTLRVVEMWQQNSLDDFIVYYSEFKEFVNDVSFQINNLINLAEMAYKVVSGYNTPERYDFALYANTYKFPIRSYLYARLDNKVENATDFFMKMRPRTLASFLTTKNIKTIEDDIDE